jgi:hypothetical protein
MTTIDKFTICVIIICLSCFVFNCSHPHTNKSKCPGIQDTLLHKFVYKTVDSAPQPVGGMKTIFKLISKNFKYPGDADYTGRVIVAFVIEPNGSIDGQRTIYDPSGNNHLFSKQLLDILSTVKWKPGYCSGESVPVLYAFPLNIDIQE